MRFDRTAYGAKVKQLRLNKGLTQEQLAEKMNVTSTYVVKIESGQRTGSVELAAELTAYFDVSLDYLLFGKVCRSKKQTLQEVILFLTELEKKL